MACADNPVDKSHDVSELTVEEKKEMSRDEGKHYKSQLQSKWTINSYENIRRRKIFVGGTSGICEEELNNYFDKFGTITDVVVIQDIVTRKPRGFGFVTFDSEKSVEDVLVKSFHDINGKHVEVKRVVPKQENHVCGGLDKLRCNNGKGVSFEIFPIQAPQYIPPIGVPITWYNNNELSYVLASKTYGGWHFMDGYRGNGYAVPYDPSINIWYVPMVPIAQACQQPSAYFSPSFAYVGGKW